MFTYVINIDGFIIPNGSTPSYITDMLQLSSTRYLLHDNYIMYLPKDILNNCIANSFKLASKGIRCTHKWLNKFLSLTFL